MKKLSAGICVALTMAMLGGCASLFPRASERNVRTSSLVDFLYPHGGPPASNAVPVLDLH